MLLFYTIFSVVVISGFFLGGGRPKPKRLPLRPPTPLSGEPSRDHTALKTKG